MLVFGPDGAPPVVAFHGVGGHLAGEPTLAALGERFQVFAPVWPGFGPDGGEELLEDMLDFALHGADVVAALGLERPHVYGHSFGGMIAAEMVALAPASYGSVALVAPAGAVDRRAPDPRHLRHAPVRVPGLPVPRPRRPTPPLLTGGVDFEDQEALKRSSSPTPVASARPGRCSSRSPTAG